MPTTTRYRGRQQEEVQATLSPRGTMAITGFGVKHTYDLLRRGIMPSLRVGKRFFVPRGALMRWLDTCGERSSRIGD